MMGLSIQRYLERKASVRGKLRNCLQNTNLLFTDNFLTPCLLEEPLENFERFQKGLVQEVGVWKMLRFLGVDQNIVLFFPFSENKIKTEITFELEWTYKYIITYKLKYLWNSVILEKEMFV